MIRFLGRSFGGPFSIYALPNRCHSASWFLQFELTPNEECMKFYVKDHNFFYHMNPQMFPSLLALNNTSHKRPMQPVNLTEKRKRNEAQPISTAEQPLPCEKMLEVGNQQHPGPDGRTTLPTGTLTTLCFTKLTANKSPAAIRLFEALPMLLSEVSISPGFVSVLRAPAEDVAEQILVERVLEAEEELRQRPETMDKADPHLAPWDWDDETQSVTNHPAYASAMDAARELLDWNELQFSVSAVLTDHYYSNEPFVDFSDEKASEEGLLWDSNCLSSGDSEVVVMIKELLQTTLRPLLQRDGGDVRFVGFDINPDSEQRGAAANTDGRASAAGSGGGVLHLEFLGACRTCKNSSTTLKDLIERTVRYWIPEVAAVVEYRPATTEKAEEDLVGVEKIRHQRSKRAIIN